MTEKELKRIQSAYESGLNIEIWFDGRWYKFDAREYPNGGFSTARQYRIVGQKYVDEAEKQIKDLQEQNEELKNDLNELTITSEQQRVISDKNEAISVLEAELNDFKSKAKEIVRRFYRHIFLREGFMELNDFNVWKTKVEAFLKEIEE